MSGKNFIQKSRRFLQKTSDGKISVVHSALSAKKVFSLPQLFIVFRKLVSTAWCLTMAALVIDLIDWTLGVTYKTYH